MRIFSIALVICIPVMSTGCGGQQTAKIETPGKAITSPTDECSRLATFESNEVSGWKLAPPVSTYDKKSIFDYINGAAELYFAYDFRAVAATEYQNGETSIMIDVYDMTASESAFGIYSLNRYPEANYVDIGNEGILTGTALDFWKGRYFCKVYSFDVSEKYQNDVINFGNRLASKIQEAGEEPTVLGSLPQNGLIPRTAKFFSKKLGLDNIRYVSEENVFNLGAETKGVVAEYQVDDTANFQLFIIEYPSPEEASSAFEMYNSYLEKEIELLSTDETTRGTSKMFKMDGKVAFIGIKDQRLWGFWDVETREAAESILQSILPFPR